MQGIRLFELCPESIVCILAGIVREFIFRTSEARLSKVACLLHQCVTFPKYIEAGGERWMLLAEVVDIGILCLDKTIYGSDIPVEICITLQHANRLPVERILVEFVLQPAVIAHEIATAFFEVV